MNLEAKNIHVPILARVEGEGALELSISNNQIDKLKLEIYEPPRFFERFLVGREPNEVIDAVARICGICPVAYQMSAVHAIEEIFKVQISPWVREMRRLFYCGEWIESHALHIHLLAAPDYFNCQSIIELSKIDATAVERGMKLHALGVDLMSLLGKRSVNPVGACIGGFYRAPSIDEARDMLKRLKAALKDAEDLIQWCDSIDIPNDHHDFLTVSLKHPNEYPMNEGDIAISDGVTINIADYEQYFKEVHIAHSTALHSYYQDQPYLVGPLARLNHNHDLLPSSLKKLIDKSAKSFPSQNMFDSMFARAVEIAYSLIEAIRILENYSAKTAPYCDYKAQAGTGFGATEAPRGILWKKLSFDKDGLLSFAKIVPPTSQNQARIEDDLRTSLKEFGLEKDKEQLRHHSEKIIRNYDPCISCSTHFLTLTINRQT